MKNVKDLMHRYLSGLRTATLLKKSSSGWQTDAKTSAIVTTIASFLDSTLGCRSLIVLFLAHLNAVKLSIVGERFGNRIGEGKGLRKLSVIRVV